MASGFGGFIIEFVVVIAILGCMPWVDQFVYKFERKRKKRVEINMIMKKERFGGGLD